MSILYVIAHPDDEDPFTLTHLCAAGAKVTLFSLTRGECGENALGPELEEALGLIRTREMIRAARAYGVAGLMFGSAFDYGYSRRIEEAEARWDRNTLQEELIAAARRCGAQLIVSRFGPDDVAEHAHHRFSAELARDTAHAVAVPWLRGESRPYPGAVAPSIRQRAQDGYMHHATQVPAQLLAMADFPIVYVDEQGQYGLDDLLRCSSDRDSSPPIEDARLDGAGLPCQRDHDRATMYSWRKPSWQLLPLAPEPVPAPAAVVPRPPSEAVAIETSGPVAYLAGTGDGIDEALGHLGIAVAPIVELSAFADSGARTVILGRRAYHRHPRLCDQAQAIADLCRGGAHVVVLAQTDSYDPSRDAPIAGVMTARPEECCEEDGPAHFLGDHPLVTSPNRLGPADLDNWYEQRGNRFWLEVPDGYTALVELQDPERPPQRGAWLTAPVGQGRYTYCALALHRQFPKAHPGAYRILANLVADR